MGEGEMGEGGDEQLNHGGRREEKRIGKQHENSEGGGVRKMGRERFEGKTRGRLRNY